MESKTTILIVDDDQALGEMLSIVLESEGFATVVCYDGLRAVEMFPTIDPDLILLDVMLPGLDGVEVAKEIRTTSQVPIIMLTAKSDTRDVVSGLEAGADDYVAKPFKVAELVARIKARLRVAAPTRQSRDETHEHAQVVSEGGIVINRAEHTATKSGSDLNLTPMEFELLFVLAANSGDVLSRSDLLEKVWGYQNSGDARLVNVHVQRLRQKVEDNPESPEIIQTVRGIGYKFVPPAQQAR
nr:MtrAB system response regulator MtrA [Bifidobacterium primatium]